MKTCLPFAVLWCVLLGLGACSPAPKIAGANAFEAHAVHQREQRIQSGQLGERQQPQEQQLQRLACRVDAALCQHLRVYVLAAEDSPANLTAQSYVGGMLVVKTPLLRLFSDEHEQLFIIAHEMAHQTLGHLPFRDGDKQTRLTLEREADTWAVAVLNAQGLDGQGIKKQVLNSLHKQLQNQAGKHQARLWQLEQRLE